MVDPSLFSLFGLSLIRGSIDGLNQRRQAMGTQPINPGFFLRCSAIIAHMPSQASLQRLAGNANIANLFEERTKKAINNVWCALSTCLTIATKIQMFLSITAYPEISISSYLLTTRALSFLLKRQF